MRKTITKTILLIMSLGFATSCSFTLSARSISKGISVLDSFVNSIAEKSNNYLLASNNTNVSIKVLEQYMGEKKKYVTSSSFDFTASLTRTDESSYTSYSAQWGDEKASWATKTVDYNTTYIDDEGERDISTSDTFYTMKDMNAYLLDYLNYSVGFMFRSYFNCVYKDGDIERSSIITGLNADSESASSWSFEVWSDYRDEEERTLGISERDYKKFFTYTRIEAVPAYYMKMKLESGKITGFSAKYSYNDPEIEERIIEGALEVKVSYGG